MDTDKTLWLVWGRQVRPGSLALSAATALIAATALLGDTRLDGPFEYVVGVIAALATIALWVGWWRQCLRCGLAGMTGAAWAWATVAITGMQQQTSVTTWGTAWCWCLLAAGLWLRDRRETP